MDTSAITYQSPIGQLVIKGTEAGVSSVYFSDESVSSPHQLLPECLQETVKQLHEYFCHQRQQFDLLLDMKGTEFQKRVWKALADISWGETLTYTQLAGNLGQSGAMRAVGAANGQNPFLVILPCHRVVGSSGLLTGYAGGLLRKKWLLEHEQYSMQLEVF